MFSVVASEVSTSSLLCSHRFKKRWRERKGERWGGGGRGRREKGNGKEEDGGRGKGGRKEVGIADIMYSGVFILLLA